jgi:uncharacterized C2H2 Zn-finger protein
MEHDDEVARGGGLRPVQGRSARGAQRVIDVCEPHDIKLAARASESLYQCEQCDRTFRDPIKLRSHVARNHDGSDNVCEFCGKELMNAAGVARHIGQKHPEER